MILVTAANGNQGKLLVPKLLAAGQLVRACVRTQASAEHLRGLGVHEIVVGRQIAVREIDADTYLKAWVGDADPRQVTHQVEVLRAITARYSSHVFVGNPNVLTWLLGRPPTTFETYVRGQHDAFLPKAGR